MKKLIPLLLVVLFFAFLYGCSDSSTESKQTTVTQTQIAVANDSMYISFNVSGTTYNFSQRDSNLSFSGIPAVRYDVTLSAGSAEIWLYSNDSSNVWGQRFTANLSDSLIMTFIPKKYKLNLNAFTGTGMIKAKRN
ncbi:MAG: hypothetical protein HY959_00595 [Ignavibacteriae bacterium]|nr:hypothetical protein [Ignavibacteriota bacterium]